MPEDNHLVTIIPPETPTVAAHAIIEIYSTDNGWRIQVNEHTPRSTPRITTYGSYTTFAPARNEALRKAASYVEVKQRPAHVFVTT